MRPVEYLLCSYHQLCPQHYFGDQYLHSAPCISEISTHSTMKLLDYCIVDAIPLVVLWVLPGLLVDCSVLKPGIAHCGFVYKRARSAILFQSHSTHHARACGPLTLHHSSTEIRLQLLLQCHSSLLMELQTVFAGVSQRIHLSLPYSQQRLGHNMICKRPLLSLPVAEVAVINIELHAFHLLPPAFHALIAGPASTMAIPSPLLVRSIHHITSLSSSSGKTFHI